jgi:ABC-type transporter Mla subunit MlaD
MKTLTYALGALAIFGLSVGLTACGPDMRVINNASEKAEADATQAEAAANAAEASAAQADAAAQKADAAASGAQDAVNRANDAVSRLEAYFASSVTK